MTELHPSGALWLPDTGTVLLADLHFGYAWAQRRRGQLGPLVDGGAAERVMEIIGELGATRAVLLGDIVHAPKPAPEERKWIESALAAIQARAELICVLGNHDRAFTVDFPGFTTLREWRQPGIRALHGDVLPAGPEPGVLTVVGHFHPALRVHNPSGVSYKWRAFLEGNGLCMLPSLSPFAAGCDMRHGMPAEVQSWFGDAPVRVTLTDGRRLLPLPEPLRLSRKAGIPERQP